MVDDVPREIGTITEAELEQEMKQLGTITGSEQAPRPGNPKFDEIEDEALESLITTIWLFGKGEELGIEVTDQQVAEAIREGEEAASLRQAHFTPKTISERVKRQLMQDQIEQKLGERVDEPSPAEIRGYFEENPEGRSFAEAKAEARVMVEALKKQAVYTAFDRYFPVEWKARTFCAEGFVVPSCSEFPASDHSHLTPPACLEADPKTPAEACPAPVLQRYVALPGSVRPWKPEGDPRLQLPLPEGE